VTGAGLCLGDSPTAKICLSERRDSGNFMLNSRA
jgi:hypothetical protein